MSYEFILALDPSGNFHEGKGTTGWCVFSVPDKRITQIDFINARNYNSMEAFWQAQIAVIEKYRARYQKRMVLVIEDYLLYKNRAMNQVHSTMETPKLIGVVQYHCFIHNLDYVMQPAVEVKTRWANEILVHKDYIRHTGIHYHLPGEKEPINHHSIDAIRHAVHFATFKNKE